MDTQKNSIKQERPYDPRKPIAAVLISAVLICLGVWYSDTKDASLKKPSNHVTDVDASVTAKEFVRQKLKSPVTAQFPSLNGMEIENVASDTFKVRSYVDSQNSYGAILRSDFVVKIHYLPSMDKWYLDDIRIEERQ